MSQLYHISILWGSLSEDLKNFDESLETIAVYALINIEWQLSDGVAIFWATKQWRNHMKNS